ncbi:hypothetical protein ACFT54_10295, partial [Streptomyces cinereoruber]
AAVSFFTGLPGRISAGLSSLGSQIASRFTAAASAAIARAQAFGSSAVSFFSNLPSRIGSALSSLGSTIAGVFSRATSSAIGAVRGLISSIVRAFSGLGSAIVSSIGDIGSQIVSKVKAGLPSALRGALPFADGGIVRSPVLGLVGEAGPEVIIPLTRPQRARQLVEQSRLMDVIGAMKPSADRAPKAVGGSITNHFTINEVGDGRTTAKRIVNRMVLGAGF